MRQYPTTFDGLEGWGSFWKKARDPIKKVLGKKISAGLSTGFRRYGLTALAAAATIVTGGAAAPALAAAAAAATVDTIGAERAKKAQRAAKREALKLAGAADADLTDAELDALPDYTFPPGTFTDAEGKPITINGSPITLGRVAMVGVPLIAGGFLLWLVLRKR